MAEYCVDDGGMPMGAKPRVAVIFGGRSGEHEVSLMSAAAVLGNIDRDRFEVVPVGITKEGRWLLTADPMRELAEGVLREGGTPVALLRGAGGGAVLCATGPKSLPATVGSTGEAAGRVDVVFPVLHGPLGEDGTVQGLLELAGVPYVGSGVLGSALGMDKVAQKGLFERHGIPGARWCALRRRDVERDAEAAAAAESLGYPCFVKPANLGSSVGITKAHDRAGLVAGLRLAARYDRKILVEEGIDGRELECSVLGNDDPRASVVGEILTAREFYDYQAKYLDPRSQAVIPADIPAEVSDRVRNLAVMAFKVLDAAGMARVDFFLERGSGRVLVNELNTIPGFTPISMYPMLWAASGVSFGELISRLIELAIERHADQARNEVSYSARRDVD